MSINDQMPLKYRSYYFSLHLFDLVVSLPRHYAYQTIGKQLIRSGMSIGANIVEAQAGASSKDFANYFQIALKSGNETKYWLAILLGRADKIQYVDRINALLKELNSICNLLTASILTLKRKKTSLQ